MLLMQAFLLCCGLVVTARPVGRLELSDVRLQCQDARKCNYSLTISERLDASNAILRKHCQFSITTAKDELPASNVSFKDMKCAALPQDRISGVWNEKGFITLAVTNVEKAQDEYFTYDRDQIEVAPSVDQNEDPSHKMDDISQRSANPVTPIAQQTEIPNKHTESWTVERLNRLIYPGQLFLDFNIETPELSIACSMHLTGPPGADIKTMSWYDQRCGDLPWAISWGYNPVKDSAVMTVQTPLATKRAFFGWDYINSAMDLPPAGPNPVELL